MHMITSLGRLSETPKGVLRIARVEINIAQSDVELQIDVRIFFEQVGRGPRFGGPVVALEANGQVQFRIDEQTNLVELEFGPALRVNGFDHRAPTRPDSHVAIEDDD